MREASYSERFLSYFRFYKKYQIKGDSMLPTLKNDDIVLVELSTNYSVGDIVVANHPFRYTPIIKRITEISTGGKLFLRGDNPAESTDSRTLGEFDQKDVLGKVICRLK